MDARRVSAWIDLALAALLVGLMTRRWLESPEGQIVKARWKRWLEIQTAGCSGCAARKEWLVKSWRHIVHDAERIVADPEARDVETVVDIVDRDLGPSGV